MIEELKQWLIDDGYVWRNYSGELEQIRPLYTDDLLTKLDTLSSEQPDSNGELTRPSTEASQCEKVFKDSLGNVVSYEQGIEYIKFGISARYGIIRGSDYQVEMINKPQQGDK